MLFISAGLNAVVALVFWLGKPLFNSITETYRAYIIMAHPILNALAIVFAGYAAINLLFVIIITCVQKYNEKTLEAKTRKRQHNSHGAAFKNIKNQLVQVLDMASSGIWFRSYS